MGLRADALASAERAAQSSPSDARACLLVADMALAMNEPGKARQALARAVTLAPGWAIAWFRLGTDRFEQGDLAGAQAAFGKAVECDPGHARSWNNLASVHLAQGRLVQAEEAARRALAIQPDYALAFGNLARIAAAGGREEDGRAFEALSRGLSAVDAVLAPARSGAGRPEGKG